MKQHEIEMIQERLRIAKNDLREQESKPKSQRDQRKQQDAKNRIQTLKRWLKKK